MSEKSHNFVMFHMGRCGSTVLESLLASTKAVLHDGEVFEVRYKRRKAENPDATPQKFLRHRQHKAAKQGLVYGCEVKYPKGTHLDWIEVPCEQSHQFFSKLGFTRFILLSRVNLLDRVVSQCVALKRGSYVRKAGDTSETGTVEIDVNLLKMGRFQASLLGLLEQLDKDTENMRSVLRKEVPDFLELTYEADILKNPNCGARKIADYVGFNYSDRPPAHTKVVRHSKKDLIENYNDVATTLRGTRFEWMLRDEENE